MVVIFLPTAADNGVWQERAGAPSRCTVQAPQRAMPQPNLVPVNPTWSRKTQSKGVSSGAATLVALPFTVNVVILKSFRRGVEIGSRAQLFARRGLNVFVVLQGAARQVRSGGFHCPGA